MIRCDIHPRKEKAVTLLKGNGVLLWLMSNTTAQRNKLHRALKVLHMHY